MEDFPSHSTPLASRSLCSGLCFIGSCPRTCGCSLPIISCWGMEQPGPCPMLTWHMYSSADQWLFLLYILLKNTERNKAHSPAPVINRVASVKWWVALGLLFLLSKSHLCKWFGGKFPEVETIGTSLTAYINYIAKKEIWEKKSPDIWFLCNLSHLSLAKVNHAIINIWTFPCISCKYIRGKLIFPSWVICCVS